MSKRTSTSSTPASIPASTFTTSVTPTSSSAKRVKFGERENSAYDDIVLYYSKCPRLDVSKMIQIMTTVDELSGVLAWFVMTFAKSFNQAEVDRYRGQNFNPYSHTLKFDFCYDVSKDLYISTSLRDLYLFKILIANNLLNHMDGSLGTIVSAYNLYLTTSGATTKRANYKLNRVTGFGAFDAFGTVTPSSGFVGGAFGTVPTSTSFAQAFGSAPNKSTATPPTGFGTATPLTGFGGGAFGGFGTVPASTSSFASNAQSFDQACAQAFGSAPNSEPVKSPFYTTPPLSGSAFGTQAPKTSDASVIPQKG
jgi:hypothetical protein